MTARRLPALLCDWPRCDRVAWRNDDDLLICEFRAQVRDHGWVYFDRKDWCPEHAAKLGVGIES